MTARVALNQVATVENAAEAATGALEGVVIAAVEIVMVAAADIKAVDKNKNSGRLSRPEFL